MWIDHQIANDAHAALKSKISFETFAESYDRNIRHIHSDNGIFSSKSFVNHCKKKRQRQSFCGVGAHHQNGSAERYIGITTTKARIMLIDAMHKWLTMITFEFWPFALSYAPTLRRGHMLRQGPPPLPPFFSPSGLLTVCRMERLLV